MVCSCSGYPLRPITIVVLPAAYVVITLRLPPGRGSTAIVFIPTRSRFPGIPARSMIWQLMASGFDGFAGVGLNGVNGYGGTRPLASPAARGSWPGTTTTTTLVG